jgi:protein-tyrosine phosphatase
MGAPLAGSPLRWSPNQQARLDQWGVPRCVDVHCHCIPGVDDGPPTLDDALELCDALVDDGITTVCASPNQLGSYDGVNTAKLIRDELAALSAALIENNIPLELYPNADVRVDERLATLVDRDRVVTVADRRRHLLLELPHELYVDPMSSIEAMNAAGIQVIMTHPERHRYLATAAEQIAAWVEAGAVLQITAGSLIGEFGGRANEEAWRLVHAGLVSIIATDAHDHLQRPPLMTEALEVLQAELGDAYARTVCLENPYRVLNGERITPCPIEA